MSKTSILVVDKDPATERLVRDNTEPDQCVVVVVDEMKAALEYVHKRLPALIVADADLPKGWRACTELKKNDRFSQIPLVIISATATQEVFYQHQGLPTRADAYLHKPLDPDELAMTFLGLLDYDAGDRVEEDGDATLDGD